MPILKKVIGHKKRIIKAPIMNMRGSNIYELIIFNKFFINFPILIIIKFIFIENDKDPPLNIFVEIRI
jgi:hypothetical protein